MKRYVYPMVLFTDEDDAYIALYPDLNLIASGYSVEDVYSRANDYLEFYIKTSIKYERKVPNATSYAEIQALNPQKIVLLGFAEVEEDEVVLTEQEQFTKNFLKEFVFTEEDNNG